MQWWRGNYEKISGMHFQIFLLVPWEISYLTTHEGQWEVGGIVGTLGRLGKLSGSSSKLPHKGLDGGSDVQPLRVVWKKTTQI